MAIKINGTNTTASPGITGPDTDTGLVYGTDEVQIVTGGTARATVDSSGNVLVGTTDSTVYNNGDSDSEGIVLRNGEVVDIARKGDLQLTLNRQTNDGQHIGFFRSGSPKSYISTRNDAFCIDVNTSERLRIDSSGRVGIGTTSPDATLQVGVLDSPGTLRGGLVVKTISNGLGNNEAAIYIEESSGGEGYYIRVDSDGGLAFDNSGVATSTLYLSDSNNVGIGTTPDVRLHVADTASGSGTYVAEFENLGTGANTEARLLLRTRAGSDNTDCYIGSLGSSANNSNLTFATEASGTLSEKMRIDSSGRLLVGTSSAINSTSYGKIQTADPSGAEIYLGRNDTTVIAGDAVGAIRFYSNDNNGVYQENASIIAAADGTQSINNKPGRLIFSTTADDASSATERMRITSGGSLLLASRTSDDFAGAGTLFQDSSGSTSPVYLYFKKTFDGDRDAISFRHNGTQVGVISFSNSSTTYSTSSDYRLKENVVDLTGAITRVKQLSPRRFNFIGDSATVDGFIAHEAQAVVSEAVTGTHNGVEVWDSDDDLPDGVSVGDSKLDENKNTIPKYQGIDQSKLVPLLTAALQEAIAKIETLETQNASLEARLTALEGGAS
jgi:hypothetical protein